MRVMAFGTFDILHPGHIFFLKKAKSYGELTVVVARDSTVEKVKARLPLNDEKKRKENIEKLNIADHVMLGNLDDPYRIIEDIKPDLVCLGYDQDSFSGNLLSEMEKRNIHLKIIRLPSYKPHKYKSSKLRR